MIRKIKRCLSNIVQRMLSPFKRPASAICSNVAQDRSSHSEYRSTPSGPPPSADMLMPSQAFTHKIDFGEVPGAGTVQDRSEQWSRDGNSLRCDTQATVVETCSGLLVPLSALTAKCERTGKYAETYERCVRCGHTFCMLHCRGLRTHEGVLLFCEKCLKKELKNWNTLVEVNGKMESHPPPQPFCPTSGAQVTRTVNHE